MAFDAKAYAREWMKAKRRKDPAFARRTCEQARAWQRKNPHRNALNTYRARAARKGILFALPEALFLDLLTDNCFYCGAEPGPINGIDRVVGGRGYIEGNVVTACRQCNMAKGGKDQQEFEAWACRAAAHIERGEYGHV